MSGIYVQHRIARLFQSFSIVLKCECLIRSLKRLSKKWFHHCYLAHYKSHIVQKSGFTYCQLFTQCTNTLRKYCTREGSIYGFTKTLRYSISLLWVSYTNKSLAVHSYSPSYCRSASIVAVLQYIATVQSVDLQGIVLTSQSFEGQASFLH